MNLFRFSLAGLFTLGLCLVLASPQPAHAQTATAEIGGRVVDPSGAAVPEADVEVINVQTNVSRSTKSDAGGRYTVPLLMPGVYRLTITKAGFKPTEVPSITLTVNQSLTQDVTLTIGAVTQRVEVKSEADLIQAASSEIGTVVAQGPTHDLPLNGRNFTQLLSLVPGVTPVSTAQFSGIGLDGASSYGLPTSTVVAGPSVAGAQSRSNRYMVDGALNSDVGLATYVVPIIVDAIQEFKVQTHNDKAEYGGALGGVINLVTRTGTNKLHGSAWEYVRNNWFDARDPFRDEFRTSPSPFRQNEYGGTVGGPVVIPKLYNGRNRTFFFFAYEGWRYSQVAQENRYVVPTNAELNGNFSNSLLNQNIYDPKTTQPDPSNPSLYTRTQFSGNMIPSDRVNTNVATFLRTYFGSPNLTGDPVHNAIVTRPNTDNANNYHGRIDEQIGSKDNAFFAVDWLPIDQLSWSTVLASNAGHGTAKDIRGGWNHLFSPTLILETRGSYSSRPTERLASQNSAGLAPMLGLGFTNPGGTILNLTSPWRGAGIQAPTSMTNWAYFTSANLIWIHGKHSFKFGGEYTHTGRLQGFPSYDTFQFTNDITNNPEQPGTTGNSLASALLGLPSSSTIIPNPWGLHLVVGNWSEYAQDEWKLRNNLTLTYGLRFDHRRQFKPLDNNFYASPTSTTGDYWIGLNQMPNLCSASPAPGSACLPAPLSQIPYGDKIKLSPYGMGILAPEWDEWGPRVGLAWRLDQRTVVRGGYGIFYDSLTNATHNVIGNLAGIWPHAGTGSTVSWNQLGQPLTPIDQTMGFVGALALPAPTPWGQFFWAFDPEAKDPRSQQWNLEIQRQMTDNLALSIGYLGSHSRVQLTGLWNTATTPGPGTPDQVNARKPFPWWQTVEMFETSHGIGDYNGLEAKLERRFAQGLYYLVSYTWGKAMDNGSSGNGNVENGPGGTASLQNWYDPQGSRAVSGYDITHVLSMAGMYELPFGRGKKYFSQHGAASWLLGNWQANMILQARSGQPFTMWVSGDVANIGNNMGWWSYERPNLVGDPHLSNPTARQWFNRSAFAVPSLGSYGNAGRDIQRSSPVYNTDFSLFKNFPVSEGWNLSFRAEFFNVFNIQNLGVPNSQVGSPNEGRITSTVGNPRQIQLALKLTF